MRKLAAFLCTLVALSFPGELRANNPPVVWENNFVRTLLPSLDFMGNVYVLTGSADPTSVATNAPKGSLYLRYGSSGAFYFKTDAGTTTNWTALSSSLINTLSNAHIWVGNASNVATDVAVSGDVTLANTGAFTVATVGASTAANIHSAELLANAATNSNTASAIVKRDGSGNFTAGTITAALTGSASGNTSYTANNHGVVVSGSGNTMTVLAPDASSSKVLKSGGASADPSWLAYDNANTVSTLVARDGSGNFSAGTITATLSGTATNATNIATTATNSTNASFFPTFVASSSSGNQGADTATGLSFNPSTNTLTTTTFSGALSGNATTATSATNGATVAVSNSASYFPIFAASSSNGNQPFNLGTGLSFNPSTNVLTTTTFSGALSGNATTATTATNATNTAITDDTTTNATMYPTWVTTTTGNLPQKISSTKLTYNPNSGTLAALTFSGALTGTASGNTTYTANNHGVVLSGAGNTMTVLAPDASTAKVLTSGGASADPTWASASTGTVTSVTFTGDGVVDSSTPSSAVTTTGTVTATIKTQNANLLLAGPTNGSAANPSFRSTVAADLNALSTSPDAMLNLGLKDSAGSNILTVAITQSDGSTNASAAAPILLNMRSSTVTTASFTARSITGALSQTLTASTTLGMAASQNNNLWIYLIDSDGAGTMKIGLSTVKYSDRSLQSTVAESFTATATNASPCVFTSTAHGMSNAMVVRLTGTPPTGFSTGTNYYVVNVAANTYQLSASRGGTAINSSSTGTSIVTHIADTTLVSDAVYTSKAVRLVGRGVYNLATPGNWSANAELDLLYTDKDPEPVTFYTTLGGITPTGTINGAANKISISAAQVAVDSHGRFDDTNDQWIVPITGTYHIHGQTEEGATYAAGNIAITAIYVNGAAKVGNFFYVEGATTNSIMVPVDADLLLTKGDAVQWDSQNGGTSPSYTCNVYCSYYSISKVPGS